MPELPSDLVRDAPEFGNWSSDHRIVVPTLASSVYLELTVPWKPRLASRYSITSFDVMAGFWTAAVVLVMLVLIGVSLS